CDAWHNLKRRPAYRRYTYWLRRTVLGLRHVRDRPGPHARASLHVRALRLPVPAGDAPGRFDRAWLISMRIADHPSPPPSNAGYCSPQQACEECCVSRTESRRKPLSRERRIAEHVQRLHCCNSWCLLLWGRISLRPSPPQGDKEKVLWGERRHKWG